MRAPAKRLTLLIYLLLLSITVQASTSGLGLGSCSVSILNDLVGDVRHSRDIPSSLREGLIENLKENSPVLERSVRRWDDNNLDRHYQKHKNEFGEITRGEYARKAREFGDGQQESAIVFDALENGRVVKLDLLTREVLVVSQDGYPITYFRADLNYRGRSLRSMGELALFLHHGERAFRGMIHQYRNPLPLAQ